jgi:hypothetical protein
MVLYSLRHPPDPQPALVVQTCGSADGQAVEAFRDLLYGLGCSEGVLFDPKRCLLVHDTFTSLGPESLEVEAEVPTDVVLSKVGESWSRSLERRVGLWLDVLVSRWQDALPDIPEIAAPFIADVVPAAAQAVISAEDVPV